MEELTGRTALVTGASGGLGTHIARRLAQEGMNVVVSGRREDALAAVAGELNELGVRAVAVPADISDLNQIDSLIERSECVHSIRWWLRLPALGSDERRRSAPLAPSASIVLHTGGRPSSERQAR